MRIREKASITVDICICLVMMNECGGRKITEKERIKRREKGKKKSYIRVKRNLWKEN